MLRYCQMMIVISSHDAIPVALLRIVSYFETPEESLEKRKLQNDPTEPPKSTLNGQNPRLNGAGHFSPTGSYGI